ncbi:unnamed protein product [Rhizoctonia solani]|uniref:REJ domain-containing protein n=1 Tax=Rhizoctonia solani TaxID=456999 RepID=A0A8H3D7H4_9AGAM|nr:unnamed protein product [Rhizoctonia solani]
MHGTTKALFVAAVALQASANPVRLFERQASSSPVPTSSVLSSLSASVATPTTTQSVPIPEPTAPSSSFPFPGSNGTYYICSFPSSNTTNSTEPPTSTATASIVAESVSATLAGEALTTSGVSTSSVSPSASKPVPTTSFSGSVPTATPTEFTVVGPSTTAVIQCIPVPTDAHPHPPFTGSSSSVSPVPPPTVVPSSNTLTLSVPTSSPLSSTLV